jgi:cytochrome c oxidase subunit IV
MGQTENQGHWWIWRVFWILLIVTTVEVVLGLIKPPFLVETIFLGTKLLNHVFIILTLVKGAYIVNVFMHLGFERKSLQWTILLPAFILVPYLLFILLSEAGYTYLMM